MTRRRIIEPGTTWALSRRTTRRHFLLNPDQSRQLEQNYWYCLGLAAQRFGVVVHAGCLMSTHSHEVVTDVQGVLPRFLQEFHRLLALTTKAFRGWPGEVFDKRSTGQHALLTPEATIEALELDEAPRSDQVEFQLRRIVRQLTTGQHAQRPQACDIQVHRQVGATKIRWAADGAATNAQVQTEGEGGPDGFTVGSIIQATGAVPYDAGRLAARTGSPAAGVARFDQVIGSYDAAASISVPDAEGSVVVTITGENPSLLPQRLARALPFASIERTVEIRNEVYVSDG